MEQDGHRMVRATALPELDDAGFGGGNDLEPETHLVKSFYHPGKRFGGGRADFTVMQQDNGHSPVLRLPPQTFSMMVDGPGGPVCNHQKHRRSNPRRYILYPAPAA